VLTVCDGENQSEDGAIITGEFKAGGGDVAGNKPRVVGDDASMAVGDEGTEASENVGGVGAVGASQQAVEQDAIGEGIAKNDGAVEGVEKLADVEMNEGKIEVMIDRDIEGVAKIAGKEVVDIVDVLIPVDSKIKDAVWGEMRGTKLADSVNNAYREVTRWRRNIFNLPTGKAGEGFIEELTKLYLHFNIGDAFESIALTMASIIFHLLLQKPAPNSKAPMKTRDHIRYLEKRLVQWRNGELDDLLREGRAIQNSFSKKKKTHYQKKDKRFITLMEQGKVSAALRCIGS